MNGRCHKDALDRAEDICELCGHQFCAQCVLYPRGRRNPPTCKSCALQNSGLRGAAGKSQPISKREYKKRKKALLELLESVEPEQRVLEPFELRDPSAFDQSTELDRRIEKIEAERPIDILAAPSDVEHDTPAPLPSPPHPTSPPPPERSPVVSPSSRIEEAMTGFVPVDTSINPLALDPPASSTPPPAPAAPAPAPTSAADLLARLKADQPIQSQFHHSTPSLDTDPFATSAPGTSMPAPNDDPFATVSPAPAPAPAAVQSSGSGPLPTNPQPKSGTWSPPAPPPRGTELSGDNVPTATPGPPTPDPSTTTSPLSTGQQPDGSETPNRRKADTDESGQWIPPSLRGMAAPDEREPLPKRR